MDDDFKMYGPFEVELKVHIYNSETRQQGIVTIGMGVGDVPSLGDVLSRIRKFQEEELPKAAPGFSVSTRRQYMAEIAEVMTGEQMQVASPDEWDEP